MARHPAGAAALQQLPLDFGVALPELRPPPRLWARQKARVNTHPRNLLFLALAPDVVVRSAIADCAMGLGETCGLSGPFRPIELLHMTLLGVLGSEDDIPDYAIATVKRAVAGVVAAPFELRLDYAMSFSGRDKRPFVLSCRTEPPALLGLRTSLMTELRKVMPMLKDSTFKPHVTLLYDKRQASEVVLPKPILWSVRDFVLLHSVYGESRHDHLGRWPLRG